MAVEMRFDAAKFGRNAAAAQGDYKKGALNPRRSPTAGAVAAIDTMQAAYNEAITSGRFRKRIEASGDAGYKRGIEEKGAARYAGGVTTPGAIAKVASHLQNMQSILAGVQLDPRGPKGTNYGNVQKVGDALRKGFGKSA